MYSQQELDDAVAAGAITAESANALRTFVAGQRNASLVDEEHFRLITGFNDIFVAIAGAILFFALGWIGQWLGEAVGAVVDTNGPSPIGGGLIAVAAWGLATYFTAKRRMALPSILFLFAFIGGLFSFAFFSMAMMIVDLIDDAPERWLALIAAVSGAIAAGGAWLHWMRFKVPVTVAAGAVSGAIIIASIVVALMGQSVSDEVKMNMLLLTVLVMGVVIFAWAMRWDGADPARVTRKSDVAFWLHLAAAPMIVHPVFTLLGLNDGSATIGEGLLVIALYVVLGLAALAIDRRALLVSGLIYVLFALTELFEEFGAIELNIALTAFVIGSALLLLSAFWHEARSQVVRRLPEGLRTKLPDLHSVRQEKAVSPSQA